MVTTFTARLVSLTNKCNSIVGKQRTYDIHSTSMNDNTSSATTYSRQDYSTMKRQSTHHHHHHSHHSDSQSNKRRKQQKEELQYTAATIQSALQAAGRPPMSILGRRRERALPFGSVNMESVKVMSSSDYDRQDSTPSTTDNNDQQTTFDPQYDTNEKDETASNSSETFPEYENETSYYDMYANLMNAARVAFQDDTKTSNTTKDQSNNNNDTDLSSWESFSSSNDFMNDKKDIDNDNRSDGVSSMGAAENSSSDSSLCQSSSSHSPAPPPMGMNEKGNYNGNGNNGNSGKRISFSVVG